LQQQLQRKLQQQHRSQVLQRHTGSSCVRGEGGQLLLVLQLLGGGGGRGDRPIASGHW
jgi:hypothetical protein